MGNTKINDTHVGTYLPMYLPIRGTLPLRRHDPTPYLLSTSTVLETGQRPPLPSVALCYLVCRQSGICILLLLIVASDCITPRHIPPQVVALLLAVVVLLGALASACPYIHATEYQYSVLVSRP